MYLLSTRSLRHYYSRMTAAVFELRRYALHPGSRNPFIELFEREFIEPQEALGMTLAGLFCDADDVNRFIWLRGFEDMHARRAALAAFYGGCVWQTHRDAANAAMIDSDDVFLLRAIDVQGLDGSSVRRPLLCVAYLFDSSERLRAFHKHYVSEIAPRLKDAGVALIAAFETEPSANDFPALPVRSNDHAFVAFLSGAQRSDLLWTNPTEIVELIPTARSRLRVTMA